MITVKDFDNDNWILINDYYGVKQLNDQYDEDYDGYFVEAKAVSDGHYGKTYGFNGIGHLSDSVYFVGEE